MSIEVVVNGMSVHFEHPPTVEQIVTRTTESPRGIAVAVDRVVVPRSAWGDTTIDEGARVEIVAAAAGG
jgi:sulfur carrier protein